MSTVCEQDQCSGHEQKQGSVYNQGWGSVCEQDQRALLDRHTYKLEDSLLSQNS